MDISLTFSALRQAVSLQKRSTLPQISHFVPL